MSCRDITYKTVHFDNRDLRSDQTDLIISFIYYVDDNTTFKDAEKTIPEDGYSCFAEFKIMNHHDGNCSTHRVCNLDFETFTKKMLTSAVLK